MQLIELFLSIGLVLLDLLSEVIDVPLNFIFPMYLLLLDVAFSLYLFE
jgi:hypothetical protein